MKIIEDGNFSEWLRIALVLVGVAFVIGSMMIGLSSAGSKAIFIIGIVVASIGGYASQAHMLKIKPFDNSYKKARESYQVKDDEEEK